MSSLEDFKEARRELELEEARGGFIAHLASYVIVNSFLVFVNLYLSPDSLWFPWPLGGWGIGLAFHYVFSRPRFTLSSWEAKVAKIEYRARRKRGA